MFITFTFIIFAPGYPVQSNHWMKTILTSLC